MLTLMMKGSIGLSEIMNFRIMINVTIIGMDMTRINIVKKLRQKK